MPRERASDGASMIPGSILNALKGISNEFEITRILGAAGCASFIIGTHVFIAWNMARGHAFNVTEYCLAFPGGLAALGISTAGAVTWKDKGVASAKVTAQTGAVPTAPASGPQVETAPMPETANGG